jgi:guanine deaminase
MVAKVFCDELVRNGTTTALVFCSSHPQSVEALFAEALARNMRVIAGKTMMDRNCPEGLRDTAQGSYDDSKALLQRWHGRGRLGYAITPRFAGSSTPQQLDLAGALWRERPDVHVHTHISENLDEIAWVKSLYPQRSGYLDVYDHAGLVGPRAMFAHGVHLTEGEFCRCHEAGAAIAHCPTSNMFLGSGQFRVFDAKRADRPVQVGLGTDIGAGTSFSILATAGEAYKAAQLNRTSLDAVKALHLATLGGARALGLEDRIGALKAGNEADLVVLDPKATPLLKFRSERASSIEELLFVLMTLGDDRAVKETWIAGAPA